MKKGKHINIKIPKKVPQLNNPKLMGKGFVVNNEGSLGFNEKIRRGLAEAGLRSKVIANESNSLDNETKREGIRQTKVNTNKVIYDTGLLTIQIVAGAFGVGTAGYGIFSSTTNREEIFDNVKVLGSNLRKLSNSSSQPKSTKEMSKSGPMDVEVETASTDLSLVEPDRRLLFRYWNIIMKKVFNIKDPD